MTGPEIDTLIQMFARLPGFGQRSARRAVLRLLQQPEARMLPLAQALVAAARAVRPCERCFNLDSRSPCAICADPGRDHAVICVVETVADLWALERAGVFRGSYHVLGGALSALGGTGPEDLTIAPLLARANGTWAGGTSAGGARVGEAGGEARGVAVTEVILALSATVDGAATGHLLADRLAGSGVRVTRLSQGVPMGGALEVLDDGTLAAALRARA